jgi:hypothetical protein
MDAPHPSGLHERTAAVETLPRLDSPENPQADAQALIKEARRRARRRHAIVIAVVLILVAGVVAAVFGTAGSKTPNVAKKAATSSKIAAAGLRIHTLQFPGPFVPQQVVAEGGRIWLLGSTNPQRYTNCAIEEVDPSTLTTRTFPLPQCAADVAAGVGQLQSSVGCFAQADVW